MAKLTKQQKRNKKKKAQKKQNVTKQHEFNRMVKGWGSSVDRLWMDGMFSDPTRYWIACRHESIGIAEIRLQDYWDHEAIPARILPLNENVSKAMLVRLEKAQRPPVPIPNTGWVVESGADGLPVYVSDSLSDAKNYVSENIEGIACFRTDSIGLTDEQPDYASFVNKSCDTKTAWINFLSEIENNHGLNFDPLVLSEYLVEDLKDKNIGSFSMARYNTDGDVIDIIKQANEQGFTELAMKLEVLEEFDGKHSIYNKFQDIYE